VAPANLIGTPGNAQATLTWVASPGATGYNVLRSTTSGTAYTIIATNINGLSYTDTGLANATTYYYVVSAQNADGNSANSVQTSVVPGSLNRLLWVASSSTSGSDSPGNALDGSPATRWSTDTSQVSGQWFQVDMGTANVFNKLILNSVNSANDYPRGYQVTVSSDGVTWSAPVATGTGTPSITTITFPVQAARYIRITQTGSVSGTFWSIDEFNAMGAAPLVPTGLTATNVPGSQINLAWSASICASGYNLKRSTTSGGPYTTIATNLPYLNYSDTGLANGMPYYYVVTATNSFGESGNSTEASAWSISTSPTPLNFVAMGGQIQISWPMDHTGWHLQVQTNAPNAGIGADWVDVPDSNLTNQFSAAISTANGSVFFRLTYP